MSCEPKDQSKLGLSQPSFPEGMVQLVSHQNLAALSMAKPLIQTGPLLQDLGHQSNGDMKQVMSLGWTEPISDLRLYCQNLIVRESPQGDKWGERRHFCRVVLVQSVG